MNGNNHCATRRLFGCIDGNTRLILCSNDVSNFESIRMDVKNKSSLRYEPYRI